jgi:hypothetical protein
MAKATLTALRKGSRCSPRNTSNFRRNIAKCFKGLELRNEHSQETSSLQSRIDETLAQLAAAQRNADEKMAALMVTVKLFLHPLP